MRSSAIQQCVSETTDRVRELKERRDNEGEDPAVTKELRKEQTKVWRTLLSWLSIGGCGQGPRPLSSIGGVDRECTTVSVLWLEIQNCAFASCAAEVDEQ